MRTGQSSYRDRTPEFFSVAEKLKKSLNNVPSASSSNITRPDERRRAVAVQSEFNKRASKIGFGIHQTSQKLSKLAKCESNFLYVYSNLLFMLLAKPFLKLKFVVFGW